MKTQAIAYLLIAFMGITYPAIHAQTNNRPSAEADSTVFFHTVERGETVYSIARMYGVDTLAIYRLNPGSNEMIKTGQQLRIRPQSSTGGDQSFIYHTIRPKETLFAVSKIYQVQASDIMAANPGLDVSTFRIGKNIRIPIKNAEENVTTAATAPVAPKYIEYTVQRRETIYRIQRKFNITQEELIRHNPAVAQGLKAGMVLRIPVEGQAGNQVQAAAASREPAQSEREVNALLNPLQTAVVRPDTIRVALLLPFMTGDTVTTSASMHITEYYQGLLLAIDSLQRRGLTMKLIVRDTGYGLRMLAELLKERSLEDMNIIIGGVENDQIAMIGAFALRHQIRYVVPFSSRNDEVQANAGIFQVNTPHSYLVSQAAEIAGQRFKDHNVIFIDTRDPDDKTEFIATVKHELAQRNILFRDLIYRQSSFATDLTQLLKNNQPNLIILTSGKAEAINKIRPTLRTLLDKNRNLQLNLYGYPEWQTYAREMADDLYKFDTYIYSSFIMDSQSEDALRFNSKFKYWYGKAPSGAPRFGTLGFDTGMFFFDAIGRFGINFENYITRANIKGLQSIFGFRRVNNWGGFINTSLFLIRYNKENHKTQWEDIRN
ncbi:MAG: LysM peptidoglycan-binding domain-containing protein [Tannerellaceae bacterium]|jgi:LysM repeat protein|nr:LysM peptidoglycan-binding domain-containing protein [Tannerellaceae bacterium]